MIHLTVLLSDMIASLNESVYSLLLYIIAVDNIYVNKKILTVSLFVPGPPAGGSGQVGQHR